MEHARAWSGPIAASVLAVLVLVTYAPTLTADFVRWDDPEHIADNLRVTAPDGLLRSLRETKSPGFYPVTYATYFLEWRAAGGRPWLFHLDNVLLHAASAVLVAALGAELGLAAGTRWLVGALWALHPVDVASVAWVTERKNVLYVFLSLASLLVFLRADRRASRVASAAMYGFALLLFAAALLSKAAAMTLPAALVLAHWARGRPLDRWFWLRFAPFAALAMVGGLGLVSAVPSFMRIPPLAQRLALAPHVVWFYLATFFWPVDLVPIYPRWPLGPIGTGGALIVAGLFVVTGLVLVLWRRLPRPILFGLGLFAANVVPVAGIVWFTWYEHAYFSDHLAYLPSLGLAFASVVGLERLAATLRLSPRAPAAFVAIWCAGLAVVTWRQTAVWHSTDTLWQYTLERNPQCTLCYYNLGVMAEEGGDYDTAATHYEKAVRFGPDPWALLNLGSLRLLAGRSDEALDLYRQAEAIEPGNEKTQYNLGLLLVHRGELEAASVHYARAVELAPDWAGAHRALAQTLDQLGRGDEALLHHVAAYRLSPGDVDAAAAVAASLLVHGRTRDAVAVLERGLARDADAVPLALLLAWVRATSEDPRWRDGATAVRLAEHACALTDNKDADALDTLAAAYAEAGRFADAVRTARAALEVGGPEAPATEQIQSRLALYEAGRPYRE